MLLHLLFGVQHGHAGRLAWHPHPPPTRTRGIRLLRRRADLRPRRTCRAGRPDGELAAVGGLAGDHLSKREQLKRFVLGQGSARGDSGLLYAAAAAHSGAVLIKREAPADIEAIRGVIAAAFACEKTPGQIPLEVALVDELRASPAWLPELSLVAIGRDGDITGHVVCTRGWVGSSAALALGPLGVRPDQQRHGTGSALMHAVLGAADALGEPLVAVLGDPRYYARFGFRPAQEYGIAPPVDSWRPHFQVRTLTAYAPSLQGAFTYPEPFVRP
ncbi:MAG: GNAT family N-acetyltransferase [Micromonosporaceae bacterium]